MTWRWMPSQSTFEAGGESVKSEDLEVGAESVDLEAGAESVNFRGRRRVG